MKPIYRNSVDCTKQLYRAEGYKAFFKGLLPPLMNLAILNTIGFALFSGLKRKVGEVRYDYEMNRQHIPDLHATPQQTTPKSEVSKTNPNSMSRPIDSVGIGMLVGFGSSFFATPFDQVKIQTQIQRGILGKNIPIGSVSIAKNIKRQYGFIRGFYNGFVVNTVREIVFGAVYFGVYENSKEYLLTTYKDSPWAVPLAGGSAGALAWFFSFPLDVVRTQIMSNPPAANKKGTISLIRTLFKQSGMSIFYRGVSASVLRAFLVSSVRFSAFELALHHLPKS